MGVKMSPSSIMAPDLVINCPWRGSARQARKPVLSRISHSLQPAFLLSSHCSILPLLWALFYSFSLAQYGGTVLCARSPIYFQTREQSGIDGRRERQGEKQTLLLLLSKRGEPITTIKVKIQAEDALLYLPACKQNQSNFISKHSALWHDSGHFISLSNYEHHFKHPQKSLVCTLYLWRH